MTEKDKLRIRELAARYMEMACSEKQQRMNKRMRDTNDLKIVRPPVLIDELPWYQLNGDGELTCLCEDERVREVELNFLKAIYRWKHFKADTLFEPFFRVTMSIDSTGIGIEQKEKTVRTDSTNDIVSHVYEDILEDEGALDKIKIPSFRLRPDVDERNLEFYTELLGNVMPVKLCGRNYVYHAPWDVIASFKGMTSILFDFYDRPEFLHAIRRRFADILIAELDFVEKHAHVSNISPDLHCTPGYISGLADDGWKATWLRTMAQPFSDVSPEMHDEFDIKYIIEIADRFAYTYYGCCEPLDKKIDILKQIKNLRKIGVSPWANVETTAEQIRGDYVFARKPNPANVAYSADTEIIRKETEQTVQACIKHGCPCELVLKDISTVSHKPENLIVWANTVSAVLDEYYGE